MKKHFYKDNFEALLNDFEDGKQMVLFLGAGINISKDNKMDWNSLLDELFTEALTFLSIEKKFDRETKQTIVKSFTSPDFSKKYNEDKQLTEKEKSERLKMYIKELQEWSKLHRFAKSEFTPLVKASIIKEILGENYITSIQSFLYSRCNKAKLKAAFEKNYRIDRAKSNCPDRAYYSLYQLARLILLSSNVRAVVTYNFDNFLTEAINILSNEKDKYFDEKIKLCRRIPKDISNSSNEELGENIFPIYHIHGYIPPPTEIFLNKKNQIVLSMEEFYDNFGNVLSWQTSSQLHFLSNYTCIFAGLSLSDITTQRMIHTAHEQNKKRRIYYLKAGNVDTEKDNISKVLLSLMNIKNSFHANYGLSPIFEEGSYAKLYERFDKIFDKITQWNNEK